MLVAGASFAGLAVAQAVRGRVVVADRLALGEGQTSACAAPVSVISRAGAAAAIQQVHAALVVHTRRREFVWELDEPFCTFDYRRFCHLAWQHTAAEFVQATVWAFDGRWVHTSAGRFEADLVADCTGWRARLGRPSGQPTVAARPRRSVAGPRWRWFGIETEVRASFPPGLHFFFWPDVVPDGYAWAFPCGDRLRLGVLSYRARTRLGPQLEHFAARFGLRPEGYHGGFLGVGPGWLGAGRVFAVGDSAGLCLPLSGEGIRSALHAGWLVGSLFTAVLEGRAPLEAAHRRYRAYVRAQTRRVGFLAAATWCAVHLPHPGLEAALRVWSRPRCRRAFLREYLGTFPAPGELK